MDNKDHPEVVRMPRRGDRVFVANGDYEEVAYLGPMGSYWGHAINYKAAGDILVQEAIARRATIDSVARPICFVYRLYIELALKALVEIAASFSDEKPPKKRPNHNLLDLWTIVRAALDDGDTSPNEDLDAVQDILTQWDHYDPMSATFRYPTTAKGEKSLPPDLATINLAHLAERMSDLEGFLMGVDGYFNSFEWPDL